MALDILSFAMGKAAGSAGGGGGSVEGVHIVTFMNEDGTVELYKRPVADGDDCADPVERGLMDEPTKESTAQYSYTHVGWSATANGALDSNILKAVTADKTVYANFAAVLRYYTVTYYDEDGTTVLKTESLAYGATPSYNPGEKGDYMFDSWTPEVTTVSGDISYTAVWKLKPAFSTASWEDIIAIAQSGNAASTFSLGDERTETITYADGTTEQITWIIASLASPCVTEDGTKDNVTIVAKHALAKAMLFGNSDSVDYGYSSIRTYLNGDFYNALPESLQSGIKKVENDFRGYSFVWLPSLENLNLSDSQYTTYYNKGSFEYFNSNSRRIKTLGADGEATMYWTRNMREMSYSKYYRAVKADGTIVTSTSGYTPNSAELGVVPCFCI